MKGFGLTGLRLVERASRLGSTCATNEHSRETKKQTAFTSWRLSKIDRHGIGIARAELEKVMPKSHCTSASTKED
jgi:hypothetical protein